MSAIFHAEDERQARGSVHGRPVTVFAEDCRVNKSGFDDFHFAPPPDALMGDLLNLLLASPTCPPRQHYFCCCFEKYFASVIPRAVRILLCSTALLVSGNLS